MAGRVDAGARTVYVIASVLVKYGLRRVLSLLIPFVLLQDGPVCPRVLAMWSSGCLCCRVRVLLKVSIFERRAGSGAAGDRKIIDS